MANDVRLQEGDMLPDESVRPIKVGGEVTSLEIAKADSGAKVTGNLDVRGDVDCDNLNATTVSSFKSTDLTIADSSDITLAAGGSHVKLGDYIDFDLNGGGAGASFKLMSILDTGDYFEIDTTTNGVTTMQQSMH